ncbi:MAG TPA: hemerythrin domain-containing protein [Armatimonadota bacterium]|nr:hemerythrin domain-containing protein [Armatimonadota bacterium]
MSARRELDRRNVLTAGAGLLLAPAAALAAPKLDPDAGVTAPEDLMKEHGVLNRCLLIYEEGLRRLQDGHEVSPQVFSHTAGLVRKFVEEYHEKNEEKYIFPQFEKAGKLTDLVATLKNQHKAGRTVTAHILQLSRPDAFRRPESRKELARAIHSFIRMYRPHEAREDTVLFPALRTILTPRQVEALGERMEQDEHKVLGDEGFERSVDQVAAIEKQLGIYDLKQFTPRV